MVRISILFGLVTLFALEFAVNAHVENYRKEQHSEAKELKIFIIKINKDVQKMDEKELQGLKIFIKVVRRAVAAKQKIKKKLAISQAELQKKLSGELISVFQKHGIEYPADLKNATAETKKKVENSEAGWNLIWTTSVKDLKVLIHVVESAVAKREAVIMVKNAIELKKKMIPVESKHGAAFAFKSEIKSGHGGNPFI